MSTKSVARTKLNDWMRSEKGRSQTSVAKLLKISPPSVHAWVKGTSRPEPHYRAALEALTGIGADEWETSSERKQREQALANIAEASKAVA